MTDEEGPPPVEAGDSAILENAQPEQIHSPKPSQPTLNKDTTTKDSPLEQQQRPQTNSASPAHSPPSKSRSRRSQSRSRDQDHRRRKSRSRSRSRERRSRSRERRRRRDHRDDDRDRDGKQQHSRRRSSRSRERSDRDHHRHKSSRRRSRSRDGDRRRRWRSRSRSRDRNRRHRHRRRSYSRSTSRSRSRSRGAPMYTAPAPLPSATAAAAAASLAAQLFPNMTSGMFPLSNTLPNLTSSSQFPNMTAAAALTAMNASASRPSIAVPGQPGMPVPPQATRSARRLYVGGIPTPSFDFQIIEFLSSTLLALGLVPDTSSSRLPIYKAEVTPERNFAFIEFWEVADCTACMQLDGIIYSGNALKIRRPKDYVQPIGSFDPPALGPVAIAALLAQKTGVLPPPMQ